MNGMGARAGIGLLLAATMLAPPPTAHAQQGRSHSDRSVQTLMEYTWGTLPRSFRHPNGEVITIDRTKKKEVTIPLEKAREVVGVADRSARAQYCGLVGEQDSNFQTMMARERESKQWSRQQIVFITLLHATTVAYLTGTMKFQFGEDGEKDVEIVSKGPVWTEPCTDAIRETIKKRIKEYVDLNTSPQTKGAAKRAEPVGTQKK